MSVKLNAADFRFPGCVNWTCTDSNEIIYATSGESIWVIDMVNKHIDPHPLGIANNESIDRDGIPFVDPDGKNLWFRMSSDAYGHYYASYNFYKKAFRTVPKFDGPLELSSSHRYAYQYRDSAVL